MLVEYIRINIELKNKYWLSIKKFYAGTFICIKTFIWLL